MEAESEAESGAEMDGQEFDRLDVTAYKSEDEKPVTTVGELRKQWKQREVDGDTFIWRDDKDFAGEWRKLASFAERWGFE